MATVFADTTTFTTMVCSCGLNFAVQTSVLETWKARAKTWYCPQCGGVWNKGGQSDADKLKAELANAKNNADFWRKDAERRSQEVEHLNHRVRAWKGQATKLKNQAVAGKCPCCDRKFPRLAEHMAKAHPDFVNEEPGA